MNAPEVTNYSYPETLLAWLEDAKLQVPASRSIEAAIYVYQSAQPAIDAYSAVKDTAKKLIMDVMAETGQTKYATPAGTASVTAPSISVSYDAKAIDILLRDDAALAMRLAPYRKESERAGTLRIVAGK